VVHVASSWRSRGCEAKDGRFDGVGCGAVEVGPNYPSLDVIFFLAHRGIVVFSFPLNRIQDLVGRQAFSHPSPTSSYSLFLRGVGVLHGVREEMRETEKSVQSFKEWEDVVTFQHLIDS
jgi:hypothetical protein